jgi:hypothetical protein
MSDDFEMLEIDDGAPSAAAVPPPQPLPPPEFIDAQADAEAAPRRTYQRQLPAAAPDRSPPHSAEAEEHVLACCLLDGDNGDTVRRCIEAGLKPESFYFPNNRRLFALCQQMLERGVVPTLSTLHAELSSPEQIKDVGGWAYLMQVTGKIPTSAHAGYFIEKVREKHLLRELIKAATGVIEQAYGFTSGLDEFIETTRASLDATLRLGAAAKPREPHRLPSSFAILPDNDPSVLLGKRYLNRGDGLVLSGPSSMGKSSMQTQMAVCWALGLPFMGIRPNGQMRSLIIQSEDSDGDIAEVLHSIILRMGLTTEQRAMLDTNIRIVTDRVNRGLRFFSALRQHLQHFKPDIVWINPLQAFMDGDVTESKDLGEFLREGLNGLNDGSFGYCIIHHTTKPATGKERTERLWHEVMYDMAGGAEIINWARAIISLRPQETEGQFKLVLAKRGRRAGVTKEVQQGVGTRLETVTTIGIKHCTDKLPDGRPAIFWEPSELPASESAAAKSPGGRPLKYDPAKLLPCVPGPDAKPLPVPQIHRLVRELPCGITDRGFRDMMEKWVETGEVERVPMTPAGFAFRRRA